MSKHTLSVLVENKPGVLARIAGLFSRRGFNIDSLAVGPTEHDEVSRMTIVVNVEESPLEQVTKQLNKLVEVIKVVELDGPASVTRELLLVKVKADAETRGRVALRIEINQQHAPAHRGESGGEVDRRGGLAHPALLIGNRDLDHPRPAFRLTPDATTMRASASVALGSSRK